jgi:hypothetical protein
MNTDITQAEVLDAVLEQMNDHINRHGQIKQSSQVIKNWHKYDNTVWTLILRGIQRAISNGEITVEGWVERDIDFLLTHIEKCQDHTDNVLYQEPKETGRLPDSVTHANRAKHYKTIKTRTFRTMMQIREALCKALGIDLPNEDSSKGKLDPQPKERLFEFG